MRTSVWPESNDQHSKGMYNSPKENFQHLPLNPLVTQLQNATQPKHVTQPQPDQLRRASSPSPMSLRITQGTAEGWPWLRFNGWKASDTWPINDENRRTVRHSRAIDSVCFWESSANV